MKKKPLLGLVLIALFYFIACKKEESTTTPLTTTTSTTGSTTSGSTTGTTSFQNQVMQGKVNGESWVMASGRAEENSFDSTIYDVDFYDVPDTTNCGFFSPSRNRVFGRILKQTGTFEIGSFGSGKPNITIFHNASVMNYIAGGSIQITKIDTTTNVIEGKISIPGTSEYNMNGNFSLKICD